MWQSAGMWCPSGGTLGALCSLHMTAWTSMLFMLFEFSVYFYNWDIISSWNGILTSKTIQVYMIVSSVSINHEYQDYCMSFCSKIFKQCNHEVNHCIMELIVSPKPHFALTAAWFCKLSRAWPSCMLFCDISVAEIVHYWWWMDEWMDGLMNK